MPYLTYTTPVGGSFERDGIVVNLWYRTESESDPSKKAAEISRSISRGGVMLPCDGGGIWITRGSPFCQSISDDTDTSIKRRYINLTAEFISDA